MRGPVNKRGILKLLESSGLPADLKLYCAAIVGSELSSSLKTALKKNAAGVIGNIDSVLADGCRILGLPKEGVLFATGFNRNNTSPERFESALAEIRAAVFLHAGGFRDLRLIGTGIKKTADICGTRRGKKYVFEVCCIQTADDLACVDNSAALRKFAKKPVDYLELKYDKKVRQVNSSRKEYNCDSGGLVFVVLPYGLSAFADGSRLKELAGELYARKNNPRAIHICILSGSIGCVFPEW